MLIQNSVFRSDHYTNYLGDNKLGLWHPFHPEVFIIVRILTTVTSRQDKMDGPAWKFMAVKGSSVSTQLA